MEWGVKMADTGRARVLLFAKAPVPGRVKTRLIPALGAQAAAELAAAMLRHAVAQALTANVGPVELVAEPAPDHPSWSGHMPLGTATSAQVPGTIGDRMAAASARTLANGERAILIGADCPALTARRIAEAAKALDRHDAFIIPASDGGYVLLALRRFDPATFSGIAWSTASVLEETLERCTALGWSVAVAEPLADIDEPEDLAHLPPSWLTRAAE